MITVVQENEQHSREVLTSMLKDLGFPSVHPVPRLEEALHYLENNHDKVDLIISSFDESEGFDFPLARFILKDPVLDRCPLITLDETWKNSGYEDTFSRRLSRVDFVLRRPFTKRALEAGICKAYENRARFRNIVAFYGSPEQARVMEDLVLTHTDFLFKRVMSFQDPKALLAFLNGPERRVGAFVFSPDENLAEYADEIRKFKRSPLGQTTVVSSLCQDDKLLRPYYTFLEICFPTHDSLENVLTILSTRVMHDWDMTRSVRELRQLQKEKKEKEAKKVVRVALEVDSKRWEVLELAGTLLHDPELLKLALSYQPHSPYAYLSLVPLTFGEERAQIISQAQRYCPNHPAIKGLTP